MFLWQKGFFQFGMDAYGSVIGDGRVRGSDDRTGETSGEENVVLPLSMSRVAESCTDGPIRALLRDEW